MTTGPGGAYTAVTSTTLDVDLQQAGQRAVTEGLAGLERRYRRLAAAARRGAAAVRVAVAVDRDVGAGRPASKSTLKLAGFLQITQ